MNKSFVLTIVLLLGACASKEPEKKVVKYSEESPKINTTNPKSTSDPTTQMLASEMGTDLATEVTFKEGSSELTSDAKEKINKLVRKVKNKKGKISEVQVVTWGDKEYPSKKKEELNEQQKDLVNRRNSSLESFFESELNQFKFTGISMAERPSFWGRVTASDKSQVKKSLQLGRIATTAEKSQGVSQASKSIIMIFYSE